MCLLAPTQRTYASIPPEGRQVACWVAHSKVLPQKLSLLQEQLMWFLISLLQSRISLKSHSSFRAPHGLDFGCHCIVVQHSPLPHPASLLCFQQLCPTEHPDKLPSWSLFPQSPPMKDGARCRARKLDLGADASSQVVMRTPSLAVAPCYVVWCHC